MTAIPSGGGNSLGGASVITSISPSAASATQTDLLLVDASTDAAGYAAVLRGSYRVVTTASWDVAKQFLRRQAAPGLVITELDLPGGDGVEIFGRQRDLRYRRQCSSRP